MPVCLRQAKDCVLQWKNRPDRMQVECFTDADALLAAHSSHPYDIILLDVVMPLLSGIEAAREIRQWDRSVKIVFLTSSVEFAVESYSVKANNYLLKPLDAEKLHCCLDELVEQIRSNAKSIIVKGHNTVRRVYVDNIEYVEADNKNVLFVLADGQTVVSSEPLYTYEDKLLLSDGFFKCNRSYIVNIYRINTYTAKEIRMNSDCRVPISRSCHKEFEAAYFSLLFGKAGEI